MPVSALDQHLKGYCRKSARPGVDLSGGDPAGQPATADVLVCDGMEVGR
ncbi:hypothetical protein ACGFIK_17455 [Micromonospora sp. NPDC048871]|nr:hypothetical protein OIE53_25110 [Micromonospora sp. NBC_01739]